MPRQAAVLALALAAGLASPAAAEEPSKLFEKSCAACHGKQGKPSAVFAKQGVKDFTDPAWQKAVTDAQVEKAIREGKKGTMMAGFGRQLSDEQIEQLVAHIRKLGAKK